MCGRARCTLQRERVAQEAGVSCEQFINGDKYNPVENMGPGRYTPVVYQAAPTRHDDGGEHHERRCSADKNAQRQKKLEAMRWGLIPSFTKPNAKPDHFVMFNARSDTLQERPAFKRLVETRRCVVICDGHYEWQQVDKKEKQPYYFYRTSGVMKFAGLYDTWRNNEGDEMHSFTILTTDAAPHIQWLHTRMPVILTDDGVKRWVSEAKFAKVKDLLVPYTGEDLKWHPVDKRLGSTKFQSEDCAKKVDIKHAGNIASFFGVKPEKKVEPFEAKAAEAAGVTADEGGASPSCKTELKSEKSAPSNNGNAQDLPRTPQKKSTSDAFFSPPRRKDEREAGVEGGAAAAGRPMKGFVSASSLLGKRFGGSSNSVAKNGSPKKGASAAWSSPSRQQKQKASTPSKKPKTSAASAGTKSPKQGTLHAFFQSAK
ncbi:hypothetical protein Gpo141_00001326 [Globisporangium polare]